jgi:hypothetical protein
METADEHRLAHASRGLQVSIEARGCEARLQCEQPHEGNDTNCNEPVVIVAHSHNANCPPEQNSR